MLEFADNSEITLEHASSTPRSALLPPPPADPARDDISALLPPLEPSRPTPIQMLDVAHDEIPALARPLMPTIIQSAPQAADGLQQHHRALMRPLEPSRAWPTLQFGAAGEAPRPMVVPSFTFGPQTRATIMRGAAPTLQQATTTRRSGILVDHIHERMPEAPRVAALSLPTPPPMTSLFTDSNNNGDILDNNELAYGLIPFSRTPRREDFLLDARPTTPTRNEEPTCAARSTSPVRTPRLEDFWRRSVASRALPPSDNLLRRSSRRTIAPLSYKEARTNRPRALDSTLLPQVATTCVSGQPEV